MKNKRASMLMTIAYLYLVFFVIYILFILFFTRNVTGALIGGIGACWPFFVLAGFAEIIELLDRINRKLTAMDPERLASLDPVEPVPQYSSMEQIAAMQTQPGQSPYEQAATESAASVDAPEKDGQ